jgi:hypothetical protein
MGMVSAALLAAIALATMAAATAQAATADQTGQPSALLAGLSPPHTAKNTTVKQTGDKKHVAESAINAKRTRHAKLTRTRHDKLAAAEISEPVSQRSSQAPPTAVWPVADAATPAESAPAAPAESAPSDATTPSTVVVGGQTVQVVAPDEINQIDLAADDETPTAAARFEAPDAAPAAQTVFAAPVHEDGSHSQSPVGSASWFAQVLAALGGAFTAGTVAWFLIGSGPVRTYG